MAQAAAQRVGYANGGPVEAPADDDTVYPTTAPKWDELSPEAAMMGASVGYARGGTVQSNDINKRAALLAGLRKRYDAMIGMAQGALAHRDENAAVRFAQRAHDMVPDGKSLILHVQPDGNVLAIVHDPRGGEQSRHVMTPDQFHHYLIGPATSFDHVIENGVGHNLGIATGRPTPRQPDHPADPIHKVRHVLQHTRRMFGIDKIGQTPPRIGYAAGGPVRGYDDGGEVYPSYYDYSNLPSPDAYGEGTPVDDISPPPDQPWTAQDERDNPPPPDVGVPADNSIDDYLLNARRGAASALAQRTQEAPVTGQSGIGELLSRAAPRLLEDYTRKQIPESEVTSIPKLWGSAKQALADYINGTNAAPPEELSQAKQNEADQNPGLSTPEVVQNIIAGPPDPNVSQLPTAEAPAPAETTAPSTATTDPQERTEGTNNRPAEVPASWADTAGYTPRTGYFAKEPGDTTAGRGGPQQDIVPGVDPRAPNRAPLTRADRQFGAPPATREAPAGARTGYSPTGNLRVGMSNTQIQRVINGPDFSSEVYPGPGGGRPSRGRGQGYSQNSGQSRTADDTDTGGFVPPSQRDKFIIDANTGERLEMTKGSRIRGATPYDKRGLSYDQRAASGEFDIVPSDKYGRSPEAQASEGARPWTQDMARRTAAGEGPMPRGAPPMYVTERPQPYYDPSTGQVVTPPRQVMPSSGPPVGVAPGSPEAGTQRYGTWQPLNIPGAANHPPPEGDNSPAAVAARAFPMASQTRQRVQYQGTLERQGQEDQLKRDTLATRDTPADRMARERLKQDGYIVRNMNNNQQKQFATETRKIISDDTLFQRAYDTLAREAGGAAAELLKDYRARIMNDPNYKGSDEELGAIKRSIDIVNKAQNTAPPTPQPGPAAPIQAPDPGGGAAPAAPAQQSPNSVLRVPPAQQNLPSRPSAPPPPVPAGLSAQAQWSPSRQQWRTPDGKLYDRNGRPVGP